MISIPFSSEFYTVFPAPNSEELISKIDDVYNTQQVDNDFFEWGRYCKVDRIPLIWQDFLDLFKPSLELLSKKLNIGESLADKFRRNISKNNWDDLDKELLDHSSQNDCIIFYPWR